jgi:hypothetical protein
MSRDRDAKPDTTILEALHRPDGLDPSHLAMLSDESRCRLERMTAEARCHEIKTRLEGLSREKLALNRLFWDERSDALMGDIREEEGEIEAEHLALRQVIALPDAELLECLDEIERERRTA